MTATSMQGNRPSGRVRHGWACTRPPLEDHYTGGKDGRPFVVKRCPACGATEKPTPVGPT